MVESRQEHQTAPESPFKAASGAAKWASDRPDSPLTLSLPFGVSASVRYPPHGRWGAALRRRQLGWDELSRGSLDDFIEM